MGLVFKLADTSYEEMRLAHTLLYTRGSATVLFDLTPWMISALAQCCGHLMRTIMMETSKATTNAGCDSLGSTAEEERSMVVMRPMPTATGTVTNADRDASC